MIEPALELVDRRPAAARRSRFRRHAGLAARMYLAGAAVAFVAAFSNPRTDGYAWLIPVVVVLQIVWCLVLGRPAMHLAAGRREGLEAFTIVVLVGIAGAAGGALLDGADAQGSIVTGVLGLIAIAATVYGIFRHRRPKTIGASSARTNVVMLGMITIAATLGAVISALNVLATSGPAESKPFLSGLLSWLGLLACGSVLAFTLGPWLWTAFVRLPSATHSIPGATAVDRARSADIE